MKLIVDLIYRGGFSFMRYSVSDTAEFGDYETGKRIITEETRKEMRKVLAEIQDGTFASKWIAENKNGRAHFNACRRMEAEQQLEIVGKELRKMYTWNDQPFDEDR
jgi:ketol-acid reductoisomerase